MHRDKRVILYQKSDLEYPADIFAGEEISKGIDFILGNLGLSRKNNNPFGDLVSRGDSVVIKPNLVDYRYESADEKLNCTTTHGSIVYPIVEYACRAVGKSGHVIIADSPIERSDFESTVTKLGLKKICSYLSRRGYNVSLLDLRTHRLSTRLFLRNSYVNNHNVAIGCCRRIDLKGDPLGYSIVDVGSGSAFRDYQNLQGLRHYKPYFKGPLESHGQSKHKYSISNTVLQAKLIINLPKMKTHQAAGVSLSLKSNIGLTNQKKWLPHFTEGCPPTGDQYENLPSLIRRIEYFVGFIPLWRGHGIFIRFPQVDNHGQIKRIPVYGGSWVGNDTLWRTILDMAKVVVYTDSNGRLQDRPQRTVLSILDGIVGGEGNGPLGAAPRRCGILMGSFDMHNLDAIATRLIGFNVNKIKYLRKVKCESIPVIKNSKESPCFHFDPPEKWKNE